MHLPLRGQGSQVTVRVLEAGRCASDCLYRMIYAERD